MILKVLLAVLLLIVVFVGYVATRDGKFRYERSGLISAPAEKVFPYISQLKLGSLWSPYEQRDPNLEKSFSGPETGPGAAMEFKGNSDAGSGRLEILRVVPNELVEIRLQMTKPFKAENLVVYRLTPEGDATRFSWSMSGDGGFLGKLVSVLIDCEKMVAGDFEKGIQNLKTLVEAQK